MLERELYGPAVDQVMATEYATPVGLGDPQLAGTTLWALSDNEQTIRDVALYNAYTNTTSVANHLVYDPSGQVFSQTDSSHQPQFADQGMQLDPTTGLYYDSMTGMWYDSQDGVPLGQNPSPAGGEPMPPDPQPPQYNPPPPTDNAPPPFVPVPPRAPARSGHSRADTPENPWGNDGEIVGGMVYGSSGGTTTTTFFRKHERKYYIPQPKPPMPPVQQPRRYRPEVDLWDKILNKVGDFADGTADTMTFGASRALRQGVGLDGFTDYNSAEYGYGKTVGNIAVTVGGGAIGGEIIEGVGSIVEGTISDALGLAGETTETVATVGEDVAASEDAVIGDTAAATSEETATSTAEAQADTNFATECNDGINCFPAGTLVATCGGNLPIEQIRRGHEVWAFDLVAGVWRLCRVLQTFVHDHEGTSAFITVQGETIESTSGHPFWVVTGTDLANRRCPKHIVAPQGATTVGRWVEAGDVRIGDELLLRDGRIVSVEAVRREAFQGKVYNFSVAELESYAVGRNNVLVHNVGECASDYEQAMREDLGVGDQAEADRSFSVNGNDRIADALVDANGEQLPYEAKYITNGWENSPYNPSSQLGSMQWASNLPDGLVSQASDYIDYFGSAVYRSNSQQCLNYMNDLFINNGIDASKIQFQLWNPF